MIKAAIRRKQGDTGREHLMATLAAPFLDASSFNELVNRYCPSQDQPKQEAPTCNRKRPMQEMAAFREAA